MLPISGVPFVRAAEHRIVLEAVIPRLDGDEPRRQRPAHRIGRAVVRAPAAVGAGIEIEHVLPGEVLEFLHPEGFHLVQMLIAHAPPHRLHRSAVQLGEVDIEERRLHVELNSKRPVAQQEVKGQFVEQDRRRDGDSRASARKPKRERSSTPMAATGRPANSTACPCCA